MPTADIHTRSRTRTAAIVVLLLALPLAACGRGGGAPAGPPIVNPGSAAWYASSSPLAVEYLRTLPNDQLGKELGGIQLSDGKRWLQGFVYLGRVSVDHPGMTVVSVQLPPEKPVTFVWIEPDGEAWPLPACEPVEKGVRARTLSGQVYTWKALRPGAGIVSLECPPPFWPAPGPARAREPKP
jgi:hypothetical protein